MNSKALLTCLTLLVMKLSAPVLETKAAESITVEIVGKLETGIFAIGGETTGTTITAKGITWELEFGKQAALRKLAEKLNGKQVVVKGSLERKKGVEIRERWIVTVTSLKAATKSDNTPKLAPARAMSTRSSMSQQVRFEGLNPITRSKASRLKKVAGWQSLQPKKNLLAENLSDQHLRTGNPSRSTT